MNKFLVPVQKNGSTIDFNLGTKKPEMKIP